MKRHHRHNEREAEAHQLFMFNALPVLYLSKRRLSMQKDEEVAK